MSADIIPIRPGVPLSKAPHRHRGAPEHLVGLRGNIEGGFERLRTVLAAGGLRCRYDSLTREVVIEDESGRVRP